MKLPLDALMASRCHGRKKVIKKDRQWLYIQHACYMCRTSPLFFFHWKKNKTKKNCNVAQTNIFLVFLWRPQYGTVIKEKQVVKRIGRKALYSIFHGINCSEKFYRLLSASLLASFARPPVSLISTVGACTLCFVKSSRRLITDTWP